MAIKDIPATWDLRFALPDREDPREISEGWDLVLDEPLEYVGQNYSFPGPVEVKARGHWVRPEFYVEISIEARVEVPCSRCLEIATIALNGKFGYLYGLRSEEEENGPDSGDESYIRLPALGSFLDITQQVWDSLILLLPQTVLCRENCLGLCPRCGANLNYGKCGCTGEDVDPRLEIFKKIRNEIDEDQ